MKVQNQLYVVFCLRLVVTIWQTDQECSFAALPELYKFPLYLFIPSFYMDSVIPGSGAAAELVLRASKRLIQSLKDIWPSCCLQELHIGDMSAELEQGEIGTRSSDDGGFPHLYECVFLLFGRARVG
ncbi:unnamed protein product [Somion occarium]|uniref:Uncharacterized protein n=1 Tax=Somion occarium TaxID=3059160 RepID=A0ABP1DEC1_9APHY